MNEQILASLQKQVDELKQQLFALSLQVNAPMVTTARKLAFGNADALSKVIPAIDALDRQMRASNEWRDHFRGRFRRIFRAHNRHVLSTVEPKNQAPGWARDAARNRRTWAKFRGWRL